MFHAVGLKAIANRAMINDDWEMSTSEERLLKAKVIVKNGFAGDSERVLWHWQERKARTRLLLNNNINIILPCKVLPFFKVWVNNESRSLTRPSLS
jgi:hypothetical protein